jgi:hypothetical protein
VVCAFGNYRIEAANLVNDGGQTVVVNKLGVSEDARRLTKEMLNSPPVGLYLVDKLISGIQRSQTVVISFAEKFHTAGVSQLLERGQYLRRELFELLKQNACNTIGYFKLSSVFADKLEHQFIRREVTFAGDLPAYFGVLIVVQVVIAAVKNVIMP